jgi:hypothetical protein
MWNTGWLLLWPRPGHTVLAGHISLKCPHQDVPNKPINFPSFWSPRNLQCNQLNSAKTQDTIIFFLLSPLDVTKVNKSALQKVS